MAAWFFFSYAHDDAVTNERALKFFRDLADTVKSRGGLLEKLEDVGFRDKDGIETGNYWTDRYSLPCAHSK